MTLQSTGEVERPLLGRNYETMQPQRLLLIGVPTPLNQINPIHLLAEFPHLVGIHLVVRYQGGFRVGRRPRSLTPHTLVIL